MSEHVHEFKLDYTNCIALDPVDPSNSTNNASFRLTKKSMKCADLINPKNSNKVCTCAPIPFTLKEGFEGKVFIYYGLTNFHQNYRRYASSRDDAQLYGKDVRNSPKSIDDKCHPFRFTKTKKKKMILPCGAIANSMFSDEISLRDRQGREIPLLRRGIAWESDIKLKFKNPPWFTNNKSKQWDEYTSPLAWRKKLWELDPENPDNNGLQNEDLIVWMRTASLPNFRKLYRIVDHENSDKKLKLRKGLPKGRYTLHINYSYPVKTFGGTKSIIIATTSIFGGKNNFLGVAYVTNGAVCLVLAIIFLIIHLNYGKLALVQPSKDNKSLADKIQQTEQLVTEKKNTPTVEH